MFQALAIRVDVSQFESPSSVYLDALLCALVIIPVVVGLTAHAYVQLKPLLNAWTAENKRRKMNALPLVSLSAYFCGEATGGASEDGDVSTREQQKRWRTTLLSSSKVDPAFTPDAFEVDAQRGLQNIASIRDNLSKAGQLQHRASFLLEQLLQIVAESFSLLSAVLIDADDSDKVAAASKFNAVQLVLGAIVASLCDHGAVVFADAQELRRALLELWLSSLPATVKPPPTPEVEFDKDKDKGKEMSAAVEVLQIEVFALTVALHKELINRRFVQARGRRRRAVVAASSATSGAALQRESEDNELTEVTVFEAKA